MSKKDRIEKVAELAEKGLIRIPTQPSPLPTDWAVSEFKGHRFTDLELKFIQWQNRI